MWEAKGGGSVNSHAVGKASGGELVHTIVRKGVGAGYAGWLGDVEGTSGEPTLGGTPGDPTSGWGVNGMVAAGANALEIGLMLFGVEAKGYAGAVVDGAVEGLADSSLYLFTFKFMNAYAIGKKGGAGGGATAGFDYERRRAQLQAQRRAQAGQTMADERSKVRVEHAQRVARQDPFAGYR